MPTEMRSYEWESTEAAQDFLLQMSGLEYCTRVMEGHYPLAPIFKTMSLQIAAVAEGRVQLRLEPHAYLMHGRGVLHGGVMSTLLDSAMSWAALSTLPRGGTLTTVHLGIDFIRPVSSHSGTICADGRIVNAGRHLIFLDASATTQEGKLLATGRSTCYITQRPPR
jgi:uncharacterized protein (TIGR00369 family)